MWGQSQLYSKKINNKPSQKQNLVKSNLITAEKNVQKQLQNGIINISKSQTIQNYPATARIQKLNQIDKQVSKKKSIIQKQMIDLTKQMKLKQQVLKRAKRQISIMRYASHQANKQFQEKKKKAISRQVQKWAQQRHLIQIKKQQQENKRQKKRKQQQQKLHKQQLQKQQFLKLQKRKKIQQRLKQIQNKKHQRQQRIYNHPRSVSTHAIMPRYKVAQLNYRKMEMQKQFQMELASKKNRQRIALDPQQLKAHQKAYIQRIKQRLNMKKPKSEDNDSDMKGKVKSDFNLYLNRKDQRIKEQLQKVKRRQKFQEKVAQIPINVDSKKKIQRQINIDKAKNPHKYMFLGQKSLNDQQIYNQFKDFEIKSDAKQIGNDYLNKMKSDPNRVRGSKSTVLKRVQDGFTSQRPSYKNYLQEVKVKKRQPLSEVQEIKRAYRKNPQLAKQLLNKKSLVYQETALKKIKQLKDQQKYQDSLKKQNQIDEMFFKSLEAKLATAQLI